MNVGLTVTIFLVDFCSKHVAHILFPFCFVFLDRDFIVFNTYVYFKTHYFTINNLLSYKNNIGSLRFFVSYFQIVFYISSFHEQNTIEG